MAVQKPMCYLLELSNHKLEIALKLFKLFPRS